jgi:hypothetical protein
MKRCLTLLSAFALALAMFWSAQPAQAAIGPLTLALSLFGGGGGACATGINIQFTTNVTFSAPPEPHTQVVSVVDGNNNTVASFGPSTFPSGTYSGFGTLALSAPASNPLTVTVTYDGIPFTAKIDDPCLPPSGVYGGPPIPAGFVLRTITCDVAVFDSPGGRPVGSNRIKAGQTWYVKPTSTTATGGDAWTEIFVSGVPNGFIPTSCVN